MEVVKPEKLSVDVYDDVFISDIHTEVEEQLITNFRLRQERNNDYSENQRWNLCEPMYGRADLDPNKWFIHKEADSTHEQVCSYFFELISRNGPMSAQDVLDRGADEMEQFREIADRPVFPVIVKCISESYRFVVINNIITIAEKVHEFNESLCVDNKQCIEFIIQENASVIESQPKLVSNRDDGPESFPSGERLIPCVARSCNSISCETSTSESGSGGNVRGRNIVALHTLLSAKLGKKRDHKECTKPSTCFQTGVKCLVSKPIISGNMENKYTQTKRRDNSELVARIEELVCENEELRNNLTAVKGQGCGNTKMADEASRHLLSTDEICSTSELADRDQLTNSVAKLIAQSCRSADARCQQLWREKKLLAAEKEALVNTRDELTLRCDLLQRQVLVLRFAQQNNGTVKSTSSGSQFIEVKSESRPLAKAKSSSRSITRPIKTVSTVRLPVKSVKTVPLRFKLEPSSPPIVDLKQKQLKPLERLAENARQQSSVTVTLASNVRQSPSSGRTPRSPTLHSKETCCSRSQVQTKFPLSFKPAQESENTSQASTIFPLSFQQPPVNTSSPSITETGSPTKWPNVYFSSPASNSIWNPINVELEPRFSRPTFNHSNPAGDVNPPSNYFSPAVNITGPTVNSCSSPQVPVNNNKPSVVNKNQSQPSNVLGPKQLVNENQSQHSNVLGPHPLVNKNQSQPSNVLGPQSLVDKGGFTGNCHPEWSAMDDAANTSDERLGGGDFSASWIKVEPLDDKQATANVQPGLTARKVHSPGPSTPATTPGDRTSPIYSKQISFLLNRFPNVPVAELQDCVSQVRQQNNGTLSGLKIETLLGLISKLLASKKPRDTARQVDERSGETLTLSKTDVRTSNGRLEYEPSPSPDKLLDFAQIFTKIRQNINQ